jgi:hypothetical protein
LNKKRKKPAPSEKGEAVTQNAALDSGLPRLLTLTEQTGDFSHADLLIKLTEAQHPEIAQRIGTEQRFRNSARHPRYAEIVQNWRDGLRRNLIATHGDSIARPRFCGLIAGDHWTDSPLHLLLSPDAVSMSATDPEQSFFDTVANPCVESAAVLKMNWPIISEAAKRGDVKFFEKLALKMRRQNKKLANPVAEAYVLHYWMPAILWGKPMKEIADMLKGITKKTFTEDAIKKAVQRAGLSRFFE